MLQIELNWWSRNGIRLSWMAIVGCKARRFIPNFRSPIHKGHFSMHYKWSTFKALSNSLGRLTMPLRLEHWNSVSLNPITRNRITASTCRFVLFYFRTLIDIITTEYRPKLMLLIIYLLKTSHTLLLRSFVVFVRLAFHSNSHHSSRFTLRMPKEYFNDF